VTLTSIFAIDKMQASRHEVEHALAEGIAIRGGLAPIAVLRDASGRAVALRVIQCEAKIAGGKLEIRNIEGTEEDIPADLSLRDRPSGRLHRPRVANNGRGGIAADRNYQVQGQADLFVGGDVVRPHLLTTAIGHGSIAAEGIDRHLRGEPQEKRPKIDVHTWDLNRKLIEKGMPVGEVHEPIWGTDSKNVAIHNFENRSDRYVIPHEELFLGHFAYNARHKRKMVTLTAEQALNNFEERVLALTEAEWCRSQGCMSCGLCFECDNCVLLPAAVFKVRKSNRRPAATSTPTMPSIGCHICKDVCPTGYIRWGSGGQLRNEPPTRFARPLQGAPPAARQSRIRGGRLGRSGSCVAGRASAPWMT
jgi:ferredoxin